MGILLLLVGGLALGSGAVKLRRAARSGAGLSRSAVVEVVVGVVTILAAATGVARSRPLAWSLVVLALGAVAVALVIQLRRVLRQHDRREASEAARLEQYLKSSR